MISRSILVWVVMLAVASVNGALREAALIPMTGVVPGRALSTLLLCLLVLLLTYATIRWIGPRSRRDTWLIGGGWLAQTLAFELLAGHFLFGNSWSQLLEDYNVFRGRIWILALVVILVSPRLCAQARGTLTTSR